MTRIIALALAVVTAGAVNADPIPVFSTGGTPGSPDPNYTITAGPLGAVPALVISSTDSQYPFPGAPSASWADNGFNPGGYPTSRWIGPSAITHEIASWNPAGTYTYQTTFDMTGLNPATASINGILAADNEVEVFLNGVSVASFFYNDDMGFTDDRFPLQSFAIGSGFLGGLNTLEFRVVNNSPAVGNSATGLRVALSGTASPGVAAVPEPASLAVFGIGMLGLAALRRRFVK